MLSWSAGWQRQWLQKRLTRGGHSQLSAQIYIYCIYIYSIWKIRSCWFQRSFIHLRCKLQVKVHICLLSMTVPFVAARALHRRAFKTGMELYKTTQKPFRPFDQRTEELMLQCQATQEFRTADLRATGSTNFGILMYPKQKNFWLSNIIWQSWAPLFGNILFVSTHGSARRFLSKRHDVLTCAQQICNRYHNWVPIVLSGTTLLEGRRWLGHEPVDFEFSRQCLGTTPAIWRSGRGLRRGNTDLWCWRWGATTFQLSGLFRTFPLGRYITIKYQFYFSFCLSSFGMLWAQVHEYPRTSSAQCAWIIAQGSFKGTGNKRGGQNCMYIFH